MNSLPFNSARPGAKSIGILGLFFLFVFSLPFLGFGLFALKLAAHKFHQGESREALGLGFFGLIFSAVGLGIMWLAFWNRKKLRQQQELKARYADQPWLMRSDWAAGKIKSSTSAQIRVFAIMAAAFCGMGGFFTLVVLPKELHQGNNKALLVLIFPAIGLGFLFATVRGLLSRRRFGDCHFEMAAVPGALGGTLSGLIQVGARLRLEHGLHLKLSCIRRTVTGSGDNRTTHENILWQDEKVFDAHASLPEPEPGRTGIPVHFKIPAGQPECFSEGNETILWRLEAQARMAGPDFSASFEVPVFKVAGITNAETETPDPTAALQMPVEELRRDNHSRIRVTDGPGGREFYFPAARNAGVALGLTGFVLIWTGFLWFMITHKVPLLFGCIFGLVDVLVALGCFNLWFKSSRVTIDSTGVTLMNRWLIFSRSRHFAAGDIVQFAVKTGMTSGTRVFQDIKLVTRAHADQFAARKARYQQTGGRPPVKFEMRSPGGITLASSIASSAEAEWLVQEMTRALGRKPSAI